MEDKEYYEVSTSILLTLTYNKHVRKLSVLIRKAVDLAKAKSGNISDPYVKIHILPDHLKLTKNKTSVKWRTKNPEYNEILDV